MGKKIILGKFDLPKDDKKSKKKDKKKAQRELEKKLIQHDKMLKKQCECNHRDAKKNKLRLEDVEVDGVKMRKCRICGALLINDIENPDYITRTSIADSALILRSFLAGVRNDKNIGPAISNNEKLDKKISSALNTIEGCVDLYDQVIDSKNRSDDDDDDGKKKKKKKKNKKKYSRVNY